MNFVRKWLFRVLLVVVFVVALLAASDNSQQVPLTFLDYQTPEWPVSWWMLAAFLVGVGFGVMLNTWKNTRLRLNARSANREAERAAKALDQQRGAPVTTPATAQPVENS